MEMHFRVESTSFKPTEGEGRNAVYLATKGYKVTAVDSSLVGLEKAKQLAISKKVSVEFIHADLTEFDIGIRCWDAIISIFCPLPSQDLKTLHNNVKIGLKDNGVYLVEAYRPEQIFNDTGGGKDRDLMQTKTSLLEELADLEFEHLLELEREIIEGTFHTGVGAVVQSIARKTKS